MPTRPDRPAFPSLITAFGLIAGAVWFSLFSPRLSVVLGFPLSDPSRFVRPLPEASLRQAARHPLPAEHAWDRCLREAKRKSSAVDCRDGQWIHSAIVIHRLLPEPPRPRPQPHFRPSLPAALYPKAETERWHDGRRICKDENDKPRKSKKNPRGHMDMECCLDPDEVPNPHCYYPPEKYGKYL